jgi:conjugal transfer pilus assembly protein TraK
VINRKPAISGLVIFVIFVLNIQTVWCQDLAQTVLPEKAVSVKLSNRDVNRLVCPGEIKDISYSQEKKVIAKVVGSNAYIKFQITKNSDYGIEGDKEFKYVDKPSEFYVTCAGNVYTIIADPDDIPAQTVRLSSGKKTAIKKNAAFFKDMPYEEKVVKLIQAVYTENFPDSFSVENTSTELFDIDYNLTLTRIVSVEGEGLRLKEISVRLKDTDGEFEKRELSEKDFLRSSIAKTPLAVSIYPLVIETGDTARVFVVERVNGEL